LSIVKFVEDKISAYSSMFDSISICFVDPDPESGRTKMTQKKGKVRNFNGLNFEELDVLLWVLEASIVTFFRNPF
jgi:hypothetical protein